ncbi:MAG: DUF262 domain-containing protein [Nostoc sp. LLA-1]|nr:DUF262 domain-containing protein [Cyanocohniella sp. LLY]
MTKVSLDALIPREAFEVQDQQGQHTGRNITTLSIRDLEGSSFFFSAVRKPDFQRETNEWDAQKICDLIKSFLDGDLIPAVILWRSASSYTFVIDGSHRLSALAAWINDDYGDGTISQEFYDYNIPEEQIEASKETKKIIDKKIGSFKEYQWSIKHPDKVKPEIAARAKSLGTLAIQVQWVEGDSSKAEESFFKINQQAAPINDTELRLLKARKTPSGVAARAIIRSGKGHKYWSGFSEDNQDKIQEISQEINNILFKPNFKNPIKTLDLPIGGKNYSSQSLTLILEFINIVNNVSNEKDLTEDLTGEKTIQFSNNCRKIARRINSNHASSLGLHPIIYFYTPGGRHKTGSFYAVVALMLHFEANNYFEKFIKIRSDFEAIIWQYEYLIQQIVQKKRSAVDGAKYTRDYYITIINKLLDGTEKNLVMKEIIADAAFNYLTLKPNISSNINNKEFSRENKSAAFIREALNGVPKCKICGGYLHTNSISIDHITRKEDGGLGTLDNAQLTHPFCNTTIKH